MLQTLRFAIVGQRYLRRVGDSKKPEAYRHLSIQFEKRQVVKLYHAVSDGIHQFNETQVDQPILKAGGWYLQK
jgi:23S rRNA pseudouridine955/2504/2580 synthase